jgi:hypothetical protein
MRVSAPAKPTNQVRPGATTVGSNQLCLWAQCTNGYYRRGTLGTCRYRVISYTQASETLLSSFSARRRLLSNASSKTLRRPQISAPTNFQHIQSGSFQFPEFAVVKRTNRRSFRPLELSIYLQDNRLSPILPLFDGPRPSRTPPHKMIPDADSGDSPQSLARS